VDEAKSSLAPGQPGASLFCFPPPFLFQLANRFLMKKSTTLLLGSLTLVALAVSYCFLGGTKSAPPAAVSWEESQPLRMEFGEKALRNQPSGSAGADLSEEPPAAVIDGAPLAVAGRGDSLVPAGGEAPENPSTARLGASSFTAKTTPMAVASVSPPASPAGRGSSDTAKTTPMAVAGVSPPASPAGPVFELPLGLQVPAVLMPTDGALQWTPIQEALVKQTREQFLEDLQQGGAGDPSAPSVGGRAWKNAQENADGRFRKLFGDDAFLRQSLKAAKIAPTTVE
jgi:hypothetical protein